MEPMCSIMFPLLKAKNSSFRSKSHTKKRVACEAHQCEMAEVTDRVREVTDKLINMIKLER